MGGASPSFVWGSCERLREVVQGQLGSYSLVWAGGRKEQRVKGLRKFLTESDGGRSCLGGWKLLPGPGPPRRVLQQRTPYGLSFPGLLTTIAVVSLAFVCPSTCPQADASFSQHGLHPRLRCRSRGASQEPVSTLGFLLSSSLDSGRREWWRNHDG